MRTAIQNYELCNAIDHSTNSDSYLTIHEDSRIVKASFRECLISDRKIFSQSKCIMPISVGQKIHEGKKFLATIKLINASFKECTILIDDSVQRHTMKINNNANDALLYQMAVKEGDDWLQRNESAYKELTIPYDIMRWDDWLNSASYKASAERVKQYYDNHEDYRNEIHANIEEFLSRYLVRFCENSKVDQQKAFDDCLVYLLEECAVMCLWIEKKYEFEVYPSGRNKAMAATYDNLIKPFFPDLLKSVAIRYKKYPAKIAPTPFIVNNPESNFFDGNEILA